MTEIDPETVAEKIKALDAALGGITRISFQMSVAALAPARQRCRSAAA